MDVIMLNALLNHEEEKLMLKTQLSLGDVQIQNVKHTIRYMQVNNFF